VKQALIFLCICIALPVLLFAQKPDSSAIKTDSVKITEPVKPLQQQDTAYTSILRQNNLVNTAGSPVSMASATRKQNNQAPLFYLLAGLVMVLALFRFFFTRYFTNLFRVFFNTSLRQGQLTDQLLQAKLPSLLFNLFFVISGGLYSYFLLVHYKWLNGGNPWLMMATCVGLVGLIYVIKFCILKFTGWVTGFKEETNTYIFILFLINKIIGIFLVPFTILMAFSDPGIVKIAVLISLLVAGFLLLLRFFRSYGLLQNQLKVSRFHFLLYIIGVELLPLLLIYKALVIFLNKNL